MPSQSEMKLLVVIAAIAIAGTTAYLLLDGDRSSPAAPVVVSLPTVTAPTATTQAKSAPGVSDSPDARHVKLPASGVRLDPPPDGVKGPAFPIASVRAGRQLALHTSPAGGVFELVGDRTEFGSARVYWIEKVKGAWLGVPTPDLPNGRLAWIKDDRTRLSISQTHFWISADLSAHRLALHYAKRQVERFPVTVGARTSPTPVGAYSVTDGLVGRGLGPWYGCCVLALSGKQPSLPSGWIGGDRIAVHGTPGSVGGADSHGCLRASDRDMISLFTRVPLGTPVFINA
jgi:lipoprotein-anchoring transpeptidase ErfK/SrfK